MVTFPGASFGSIDATACVTDISDEDLDNPVTIVVSNPSDFLLTITSFSTIPVGIININ